MQGPKGRTRVNLGFDASIDDRPHTSFEVDLVFIISPSI